MNKKAALFHWIIFGVLAALGLFFVLTSDMETGAKVKGEWQLDFLKNYYLEGEKDLLRIDREARQAGWQTALELGEKGGFIEKGNCGDLNGYNLWNKLTEWSKCLPEIEKAVTVKVKEKLAKSLGQSYSEIKTEGKDLMGKGEEKSIISTEDSYVKYTYDTSFRVDLSYSFEEYEQIKLEAQELVANCRNNKNLEKCAKEEKKDNWKLKDYDKEEYNETERKVLFCIESETKLYDRKGELRPVRYKFALDFTPTKPFMVEEVEASFDAFNNFFEISFKEDKLAEGYRIYFTNFMEIADESGEPKELEDKVKVFSEAGFFWDYKEFKKEEIIDEPEKCASGIVKEANKAYLCEERIFFSLSDVRLKEGGEYLFGVTTVKEGQESEIKELVKIQYT